MKVSKKEIKEQYRGICEDINQLDEELAEKCLMLVDLEKDNPKMVEILKEVGESALVNEDYESHRWQ